MLKNLTIKTKLIVNLVISICIILIIGLMTFVNLQKLHDYQNTLNEINNRALLAVEVSSYGEKLYSIIADSLIYDDIENAEKEFAIEKDNALEQMELLKEGANQKQKELLSSANTEYLKIVAGFQNKVLTKLKNLSGDYNSNETYSFTDSGSIDISQDIALNEALLNASVDELRPYIAEFESLLNQVSEDVLANAELEKAKFEQTVRSIIMTSLILIGIGIVLILLAAIFIMKSITSPLNKAVHFVENISKWDMSQDISVNNNDEIGVLVKAMKNMSENIKERISVINEISAGNLDVSVEKASENDDLAGSINTVVASLTSLISETKNIAESAIQGKLHIRGQAGEYSGAYGVIVSSINNIVDTLVNHIDSVPSPIMIIDKNFDIQYMNKSGAEVIGLSQNELLGMKCYDCFKTSDCNTSKCAAGIAMNEDKIATSETEAHPGDHNLEISYDGIPLNDSAGQVLGSLEVITDLTDIKKAQRVSEKQIAFQEKEVQALTKNLELLAQGNLNMTFETSEADEDTRQIAESFEQIKTNLGTSIEAIKAYITEISDVLTQIANSNLDVEITNDYMGDFSAIKDALNLIIESFNHVLYEINSSSDQVATGAGQLSASSQELSQGAAEQTNAIEQLTTSITQLASQTKENAENANNANVLTNTVKQNANTGNTHMQDMLSSMDEINSASNNISKIIKVIDEIAFQTNILALNAAVEAARAGEHGKGFAVVAEEVRNLAARSAQAAQETTDLIEGSIQKAESGTKTANDTATALNEIIDGVTKAAELIEKIAASSNEQSYGINEINDGIEQVSKVVQTNSSTAEESAASSEELSAQAQTLKEMVEKFKLKASQSESMPRALSAPDAFDEASLDEELDKNNPSEAYDDTASQFEDNNKSENIDENLEDDDFGKY